MTRAYELRNVNGTASSAPFVVAVCTIAAAVFCAIGWAAVARLPELVRAPGQIGPLNDLVRIDHYDGGVVQALMVNPGDRVTAGQLLAVVTDPDLTAALRASEQRTATLERDRLRLMRVLTRLDATPLPEGTASPDETAPPETAALPEGTTLAEGTALPEGTVPPEGTTSAEDTAPPEDTTLPVLERESDATDTALAAYVASQSALFDARRASMQARIDRLALSIGTAEAMRDIVDDRRGLAESRLEQGRALFAQGHLSRSALADREDTMQRMEQARLDADLALLTASDALQEARGELVEAETAWREDLISRLYEIDSALKAQAITLQEAQLRAARAEIRAPRAGTIQSVTADAVGQFVAPGGQVMDMLAADDRLVAIVKLSPDDIGHAFVGAPVRLRPTTFDYRRFGDLGGEIVEISPSSLIDDTGQPYFRTVVALDALAIGHGRDQHALRAGMEVSAEIVTSERSVLAYFLKPAERILAVSLTER